MTMSVGLGPSMAAHLPPSRCGLSTSAYATRKERRPTLPASACAANGLPSRGKAQCAAAVS